jgi:hypothetical protein
LNSREFYESLRKRLPALTAEAAEGWRAFAAECAEQGQFVDFVSEQDVDVAVGKWLDTLYAGIVLATQKYGTDIGERLAGLSTRDLCLYPYEMDTAAEHLANGGSLNELSDMLAEGIPENDKGPLFPKPEDSELRDRASIGEFPCGNGSTRQTLY